MTSTGANLTTNPPGAWAHLAAHHVREAVYAGSALDRQGSEHRASLRGAAEVERREWVDAVACVLRWVRA
ncbi:MAG: hypothetical protein WC211_00725 [Dehalococcoidia bacterium]